MPRSRPITRRLLTHAWSMLPTKGIQAIASDLGVRYGRLRRAMMEDNPGRYETSMQQKRQQAGRVRAKQPRAVMTRTQAPKWKRRKPLVMVGWDDAQDPVMARCRADVAKATGLRRMTENEFSEAELAALREKVRGWVRH